MLPTPPEAWLDLGGVSVVGGLVPRGVVEAWEFAEWVVVVKEGILQCDCQLCQVVGTGERKTEDTGTILQEPS